MVRRNNILRHLVEIYYDRNDNICSAVVFCVGRMCSRSNRLRRKPPIASALWGDEIERITEINPLTGEVLADHQQVDIYPAKHFVTPADRMEIAIQEIQKEWMIR